MKEDRNKLETALLRREQGRSLTNTEIGVLRRYDRDRARAGIPALRTNYVPRGREDAQRTGTLQQGRDKVERTTNAGAGSDYTEGAAIDVVGSDGKLNKAVKHSTWATPTDYPTRLKVDAFAGSVTLSTDATGSDIVGVNCDITLNGTKTISITNHTGEILTNGSVKVTSGSANVEIGSTGLVITTAGGNTCSILFAAITRNMSVQTIAINDNGVCKSMLVLGSAPFP